MKKTDLGSIVVFSVGSLAVIGCLALGGFIIYCWATYGGKPVGEVPTWALWLMWGRR